MDWATLAGRFEKIRDPYGTLRLDCSTHILDSEERVEETWTVSDYLDANTRAEFEAIAHMAAVLLASRADAKPDHWYCEIRRRGLGRAGYPPVRVFEMSVGSMENRTIHDVVAASVSLCRLMESESFVTAPANQPELSIEQVETTYDVKLLGQLLRRCRESEKKRLTRQKLADEWATTPKSIDRWEKGSVPNIKLEYLGKIEALIREVEGQGSLDNARTRR